LQLLDVINSTDAQPAFRGQGKAVGEEGGVEGRHEGDLNKGGREGGREGGRVGGWDEFFPEMRRLPEEAKTQEDGGRE